ncbi:MAG: metallophosphoesterase family protein [Chloroflexi bacterium]|nr:metallophosphoesterase family protein [Chloroflexota bacterium]
MNAVIGLIADTHIPDAARALPVAVERVFRSAGVCCILHAGDIIVPSVLQRLGALAPVYAVRGNRDMFAGRDLPRQQELTLHGVRIGLTHGHGPWRRYLKDKLGYLVLRRAPAYTTYIQRALATFPQADVVVFGHTHYPCVGRFEGRWVINPGSPLGRDAVPGSVGLLHVRNGYVLPEIVFLPAATKQNPRARRTMNT